MAKLAIKGGKPVRDIKKNPWPSWPVWSDAEKKSLGKVLDSGVWSYNGPMETKFNGAFKNLIKSKFALSVSNGTVSLQLAMEALDIGYGDEVIVPGLTWQATPGSVLDVNAIPILVDVDPQTWCVDPKAIEAAITPDTRAIIPVHLYGCISDMDKIMKIAKKHGLAVVEDCAHQHGSVWKKKPVGSIGDIGSFSFQLSKVLTAGEGGALTTNSKELFIKLDALRNCGRRPVIDMGNKGSGQYVSEGDLIQSGNYRITEFQAAVLCEQLKRLPAQIKKRDQNAIYLNSELKNIDGITPMKRDKKTSLQSYFNFVFKYDSASFKGLSVWYFRPALAKELGVTVEPCYIPLNNCPLYRPLTKNRYNINKKHQKAIDPSRFKLPECQKAFETTSVAMHHSVLMGTKKDMDQIVAAIKKIQNNVDELF
jgi:dTDP-4-amino-4,6-dideoxygalactose transaminase